MFVVVASQEVAEGLLGALWPGRSVSSWKEKRKEVREQVFGTKRGWLLIWLLLPHPHSTPIHTPSRPLKTMLACPSLKISLSSQGVDTSSRLVSDVGEFTFHFAIAFGFMASSIVAL
jgi:hypothetical protein